MKTLRIVLVALVALAAVLAGSAPTGASSGITERVSVDSGGNEGNDRSYGPAISADGRYVAFWSFASNLVTGDANDTADVFVHDRQTGTTERVSVDSAGNEANGSSMFPAISSDGRYVAFWSVASNLVEGDTNEKDEIFVHDRQTGATERVSVDTAGNEANGWSRFPAISSDGRYVAFESAASNLVAGDTNNEHDVFLHDRQTETTERVSVDSAGVQGNGSSHHPAMSGDGRYVAFTSCAPNLVTADTNEECDVFVHDRQTGITERVSVDSGGNQGNALSWFPAISDDGRYVAFASDASNLVGGDTNEEYDVFLHDRQTGITERVSVDGGGSQSDGWSCTPHISADGRYVAFPSVASNLVAGDTNEAYDVFVHDRQTGTTERVSVDSDGNEGNGDYIGSCTIVGSLSLGRPSLTGGGRYVAFWSDASDLVPGDTNNFCGLGGDENCSDIFVHGRETESVTVEAGAGETVTTDSEADGATALDPVETSVTTPNPGTVSIEETPIIATPPAGFQFLSQQVSITAPSAATDDPLVIVFRIDSSQIPVGEDQNTIQMFKDGVEVPACAGPPGTASPDPCVSNRALLPDGDVEITVLTSTASAWNFGAPAEPSPTPTPTPAPVGGVAELPDAAGSAGRNYVALAGLAAAAVVALSAGGWYGRRLS